MGDSAWGSIQSFLLTGQLHPSTRTPLSPPSAQLDSLGRRLATCTTKLEEKEILDGEIESVEVELSKAGVDDWKIKDCLIRAMVCAVLGRSCQSAAVHGVKLASNEKLYVKYIGYLSTCVLLNPDSDLRLLLVNTWLKDLSSNDPRAITAALPSVQKLMPYDTLPVLITILQEKLKHRSPSVRSKVCLVLHHVTEGKEEWQTENRDLALLLADDHPTVISAALNVILQRSKGHMSKYVQFVPQLCSIQQSVLKGKFARDPRWQRKGIPVPQLQVLILKLLTRLGQQSSVHLQGILKQTLNQSAIDEIGGLAVAAETVSCILVHKERGELFGETLQTISNFLKSPSLNLKYVGIRLFTEALSSIPAEFVSGHQGLLVKLLEHTDPSIQRHMAKLLTLLANPDNVQWVTRRISDMLSTSNDQSFKESLLLTLVDRMRSQCNTADIFFETVFELMSTHPDVNHEHTVSIIKDVCLHGSKFGSAKECQKAARHHCMEVLKNPTDSKLNVVSLSLWVISNFTDTTEDAEGAFVTVFSVGNSFLQQYTSQMHRDVGSVLNFIQNKMVEESGILLNVMKAVETLVKETGREEVNSMYSYRTKREKQKSEEKTWFSDARLEALARQFFENCEACPNTVIVFKAEKLRRMLENLYNVHESLRKIKEAEPLDLTLSFLDRYVIEQLKKRPLIMRPGDEGNTQEEKPLYFISKECVTSEDKKTQSNTPDQSCELVSSQRLWSLEPCQEDPSPVSGSKESTEGTSDEQKLASMLFGSFLKKESS